MMSRTHRLHCTTVNIKEGGGGGGLGVSAYSRQGAYLLSTSLLRFLPSGWALIRRSVLIRINLACNDYFVYMHRSAPAGRLTPTPWCTDHVIVLRREKRRPRKRNGNRSDSSLVFTESDIHNLESTAKINDAN